MFISLKKKQYYMLSQEAKIDFPLPLAMSQLPINTPRMAKIIWVLRGCRNHKHTIKADVG